MLEPFSDYKVAIAHLIPAFDRYVNNHIPTGGFLRACLENNLKEAVGRADHINLYLLPEIASYMYNDLPHNCWGSHDKVEAWLEARDTQDTGPVEIAE